MAGAKNGTNSMVYGKGKEGGSPMLTVPQVADLLNAHPHSVRRWGASVSCNATAWCPGRPEVQNQGCSCLPRIIQQATRLERPPHSVLNPYGQLSAGCPMLKTNDQVTTKTRDTTTTPITNTVADIFATDPNSEAWCGQMLLSIATRKPMHAAEYTDSGLMRINAVLKYRKSGVYLGTCRD